MWSIFVLSFKSYSSFRFCDGKTGKKPKASTWNMYTLIRFAKSECVLMNAEQYAAMPLQYFRNNFLSFILLFLNYLFILWPIYLFFFFLSFVFFSCVRFICRNPFVQYEKIARLRHWNRWINDNNKSIGFATTVPIINIIIVVVVNRVRIHANCHQTKQLLCQLLAGKINWIAVIRYLLYKLQYQYSILSAHTHIFQFDFIFRLLFWVFFAGISLCFCDSFCFCAVNCRGQNWDIHRAIFTSNTHTQLIECHQFKWLLAIEWLRWR